ncbi:SNF1-related protein kinase regulatory subunit gamma-1-like [Argentina anserina]|uniref:SNF1-related protein kinase regulatory subunit gamma-1-like n=1 Tax=Argentina anserina TaxID=57926 RepID=UPI00217621AC|nr:SNF1-related protein kinase regulatory subunit gamma-1-like [Potentilla anserina]
MTEAAQEGRGIPKSPRRSSCYDAYFERIQSRKKLPHELQENLTYAFSKVLVSSFQALQGGKVIEIAADISIPDAVRTLSEHKILSAPVITLPDETCSDWRERYLGTIDYSAVLVWVLESAEHAARSPSSATSVATTAGGNGGAGAVGAIGAVALGVTRHVAVAGLTAAAVASAVAGNAVGKIDTAAENERDTTANKLTPDLDKVILQNEPCKSTTVNSIVKSFRGTPFLPVAEDSSMLTILLLLSKYRIRNVPVIEDGQPKLKNYITQSAVIRGLEGCKGMEWFDCIAEKPISDLGLPFMSCEEVIDIQSEDLMMEAFKKMKDKKIGGLPVVEGQKKKLIGNVSVSDIRYVFLRHDLLSNFRKLTVMDFLTTISTSKEPGKPIPPVTCNIESSLGNVIEILASKSVHRVYVIGAEEGKVVGVITLRDVISCFIYEPPNYFDAYLGFAVAEILKQQ